MYLPLTMARVSPRKKATVSYSENDVKPAKTNGTPSKAAAAKADAVSAKRKHAPEGKENEKPPAEASAPPKKRKTAKAKEEEEPAMPLAERTAVSGLKKSMYIGAHVSAAGGRPLPASHLTWRQGH